MNKSLIISKLIKAEVDNTTSENGHDVVIFPVGEHTITASDENDEPVTLTVDVNAECFNRIKSCVGNIKERFADYNHEEKESSGWLQDLKWDATKGIIATVNWTQEAYQKIKDRVYCYISPSFEVDDNNNIVALSNPAFALTNLPAFDALKNWPVKASKNSKKKETNMDKETEVKVDETKTTEVKAESTAPVVVAPTVEALTIDAVIAKINEILKPITEQITNFSNELKTVKAEQGNLTETIKAEKKNLMLSQVVKAEKNTNNTILDGYIALHASNPVQARKYWEDHSQDLRKCLSAQRNY